MYKNSALKYEPFSWDVTPRYECIHYPHWHYHDDDTRTMTLDSKDYFNEKLNVTEFVKEVVTGPTRELKTLVDRMNDGYMEGLRRDPELEDIDMLRLTPKLMWAKGQYDNMRRIIDWYNKAHMKPRGMNSLFDRQKDGPYAIQSFRNHMTTLENKRLDIRRQGLHLSSRYSREEIVETYNIWQNELDDFIKVATDFNPGMSLRWGYLSVNNQTELVLMIKLSNTTLKVMKGDNYVTDIHARPIYMNMKVRWLDWYLDRLESATSIRTSSRASKSFRGEGTYPYYGEKYPYINGSGLWDNLCLSDYQPEIISNLVNLKAVNFAMSLKKWSSTYNYDSTNPYHKPDMMFIGMPKRHFGLLDNGISVSHIKEHCEQKIAQRFYEDKEGDQIPRVRLYRDGRRAISHCHGISCEFIGACRSYGKFKESVTDREKKIALLDEMIGLSNECDAIRSFFDYEESITHLYNRYIWYKYEDLVNLFYDLLELGEYYPITAEACKEKAGDFVSFEYYESYVQKAALQHRQNEISTDDFHAILKDADTRWKSFKTYITLTEKETSNGQERINL